MSDQTPNLPRALFGYERTAVARLLADRETIRRQAEGRTRAAEARLAELEAELTRREEELHRIKQQLGPSRERESPSAASAEEGAPPVPPPAVAAATGPEQGYAQTSQQVPKEISKEGPEEAPAGAAPAGAAPARSGLTARFIGEELSSMLAAAEESAARIVERARQSTDEQVAEADRAWAQIRGEVDRFEAWRGRFDPVLDTLRSRMSDLRRRLDEVPGRIQEALSPVAHSVSGLEEALGTVEEMAPPRLTRPEVPRAGGGPQGTPEEAARRPAAVYDLTEAEEELVGEDRPSP